MEGLLIGLRIMALLTLARWLTPSTATLSSWAKGLGALTLAYTPIHGLTRGDAGRWQRGSASPYSGSLDIQYASTTGTDASQQTDPVDSA